MTMRFGGIDIGKKRHFPCVLDLNARRVVLPPSSLTLSETIQWIQSNPADELCLDGPPRPHNGSLARHLAHTSGVNTNRRVAEYQLGIGGCYGTPAQRPALEGAQGWMAAGMELYDELQRQLGYQLDLGGGQGNLIETHPTYAFKALLGHQRVKMTPISKLRVDPGWNLRPKRFSIGADQRLNLVEELLSALGITPTQDVRDAWTSRIDWIDATMCAAIAAIRRRDPTHVAPIGDPTEGAIVLYLPDPAWALPAKLQQAPSPTHHRAAARAPAQPRSGANAVILRLGSSGPLDMSQQDTIETALSSYTLGECWIPIGSTTSFRLDSNLQSVRGSFYLAFGNTLRLRVMAGRAMYDTGQQFAYPGSSPNPWIKDGKTLHAEHGWVEALDVQDTSITHFRTTQHGAWRPGYGKTRRSLLFGKL